MKKRIKVNEVFGKLQQERERCLGHLWHLNGNFFREKLEISEYFVV